MEVLSLMRSAGVRPSAKTYNVLIRTCVRAAKTRRSVPASHSASSKCLDGIISYVDTSYWIGAWIRYCRSPLYLYFGTLNHDLE